MQMTETEIVRNYKEAKNKNQQIEILSDLNACDKGDIRIILIRNKAVLPGIAKRKEGPKIDWSKEISKIKQMRQEGKKLREIALLYGVTDVTISKILKRDREQEANLTRQLEKERNRVKTVTAELESWKQAAEEMAIIIENNNAKEEERKTNESNSKTNRYSRIGMGCF